MGFLKGDLMLHLHLKHATLAHPLSTLLLKSVPLLLIIIPPIFVLSHFTFSYFVLLYAQCCCKFCVTYFYVFVCVYILGFHYFDAHFSTLDAHFLTNGSHFALNLHVFHRFYTSYIESCPNFILFLVLTFHVVDDFLIFTLDPNISHHFLIFPLFNPHFTI